MDDRRARPPRSGGPGDRSANPSGSAPRPGPEETTESRARTRALRILARREQSRRGLDATLARAGFPAPVRGAVLDDLERRGLLSDLRFSRLYLGEQARFRPRSVRLLRRDLQRAGVDGATIDRALAEAGEEVTDPRLVREAARKKLRTAGNDPAKLSRLLSARGFAPSLVLQAVREAFGGAASVRPPLRSGRPGRASGGARRGARRPGEERDADGPSAGADPSGPAGSLEDPSERVADAAFEEEAEAAPDDPLEDAWGNETEGIRNDDA